MDVDANVNMDCITSQELDKLEKFYSNVYKCNLEEPGWSSLTTLERAIHQKALKSKFQFPTNNLNDDVELLVELYPPKPFKPKIKKTDKPKLNGSVPTQNGTSNGIDSGTGQTLDDSTDQGFAIYENNLLVFYFIRYFIRYFMHVFYKNTKSS